MPGDVRYVYWQATCPRCGKVSTQDDYTCTNCGHHGIVLGIEYYRVIDEDQRYLVCRGCSMHCENLKCSNPDCDCIIDNIVDELPRAVPGRVQTGSAISKLRIPTWLLFILIIVSIFILVVFIKGFIQGYRQGNNQGQQDPVGSTMNMTESYVGALAPNRVDCARSASNLNALRPEPLVENRHYLLGLERSVER